MPAKISEVLSGSIAEELELVSGDILLSIDGNFLQSVKAKGSIINSFLSFSSNEIVCKYNELLNA